MTLGLIPNSGGTQRLLRLMVPSAALSFMVAGQPRTARELATSGLFDVVVDGELLQAARRQVERLLQTGGALPRARDRLCGSGLNALGSAARAIRSGDAALMFAGGVESMSRAAFVMPKAESAFSRSNAVYDTTIAAK